MISFEPFSICQLSAKDLALMEELLAVFGEAFEEVDRYSSSLVSSKPYLSQAFTK
jgi:aminoglycoside 3-N-acetyltransferase I